MASFDQNQNCCHSDGDEEKSLSVEIIKGKLYWICSEDPPTDIHYFNVDNKLKYIKYYKDFGPACIANIVNFCRVVKRYMYQDNNFSNKPLYFHCSTEKEKQSNAALLICAFQVIVLNRSPDSVWEKVKDFDLLPFRDASYNEVCEYQCTILDCLRAIKRSIELGWFNLETFDIKHYEQLENQDSGNISIIIPNKIFAFRGPLSQQCQEQQQKQGRYYRISVDQLVPQLKLLKTSVVVRCNSSEEYEREDFLARGVDHVDLFFPDGSCPKDTIIQQFIEIVDNSKGYVGVHCKAGLGRTGTLIACYAIQKFNYPAREIIAWTRLCRSGSILGKQQHFLLHFENKLSEKGIFKQESSSDVTDIISQKSGLDNILSEKQSNVKQNEVPQEKNQQQCAQKERKQNQKMSFWSCFGIFKKKSLVVQKQNMNSVDFYKEEPNQAEKLIELQNENINKSKHTLRKQNNTKSLIQPHRQSN